MARYIVKASPDRDAYFMWSTEVDFPVGFGTREEMLTESSVTEERMERADSNGTSAQWSGVPMDKQKFGWHDGEFLVASDGLWNLPRTRLIDLWDLWDQDEDCAHIPLEWMTPPQWEDEDD